MPSLDRFRRLQFVAYSVSRKTISISVPLWKACVSIPLATHGFQIRSLHMSYLLAQVLNNKVKTG